ncbi:MAG: right-handed parallel beta-helix repeat-containing protein [Methylococcaceae bacterium]|nr:right-handed parallel beta-helix repeat-containing protein [Methylococcaceae bacterium]
MIKKILNYTLLAFVASTNAKAINMVHDEASLQTAMVEANADSSIYKIVFEKNAKIILTKPAIYNGKQAIILDGNNAIINGAAASSFLLDRNLTATHEKGSLIFNTAADIKINNLTVKKSATRGIVINIPGNATDDDIMVTLHKVNVLDSALYGLHIDDNTDNFDDGLFGSKIGIKLKISKSNFTGNGISAIDFDGIRIDERGEGNIDVRIKNTHIDGNGGDGIELDEAGDGDVTVNMEHVTLNNNGFYNKNDFDDGFDIDEAGNGDIKVHLSQVQVNENMDEGLDFDEADSGDLLLNFNKVRIVNNLDEGIKIVEKNEGDIKAKLTKIKVKKNGSDGIQFTELGAGEIRVTLKKITAIKNKKYGIRMEQWFKKGEANSLEAAGKVKAKQVVLKDNKKGNQIKINNIIVD